MKKIHTLVALTLLTFPNLQGADVANFSNSGQIVHSIFSEGYTQAATDTLNINIASPILYSSIHSTEAHLDGTLNLTALPAMSFDKKPFPIIQATKGIKGEFNSIQTVNFPSNVEAVVTYGQNAVFAQAVPRLNGYISLKEVTFSTVNQIHFILLRQLERLKSLDPCDSCCAQFNVYIGPIGSSGSVYTKRDVRSYNFYTGGVITGIESSFCNFDIGLEFDYERIHGKVKHSWGHFDIDQFHASLYATYAATQYFSLDAIIGGGYDMIDIRRRTGSSNELIAKGQPGSSLFDAFLGAEYLFNCQNFSQLATNVNFIPFAALQVTTFEVGSYREKGASATVGSFNVNFHHQHYDSYRSTLGLKLNALYEFCGLHILPEINLAWQKEFQNDDRLLGFQTPHLNSLVIPVSGRDTIFAGIDVFFEIYKCTSIDFSYEFEGNQLYINNFFYLGLNSRF